jgi:hypothetical protein
MGTNTYKQELQKMMTYLIENQSVLISKCYRKIKETDLFQHCSRAMLMDEVCDPGPLCSCYMSPYSKWRLGDCPMADKFLQKEYDAPKEKVRTGQQKGKKKRGRQ